MSTTKVKFSNFASTTIVGTYNAAETAITVASSAAFPAAGSGTYFYAVLVDSLTAPTRREIVKVTNVSGSVFTVTRAQESTTAQAWTSGSYIELRPTNQGLQDLHDEARDKRTVFFYMTSAEIADVEAGTAAVDVSSALSTAFAAGVGEMPAGVYKCNSAVTIGAANGLTIQGAGSSKTEIRFATGLNGISLTYSNSSLPPAVIGVSITSSTAGPSVAGTALTISGSPTGASTIATNWVQGPQIKDVVICGLKLNPTNPAEHLYAWNIGLRLISTWYPLVDGFTFKGYSAAGAPLATYESTYAIYMTDVMAPFIKNIYLYHVNTGIYEDGSVRANEGMILTQFEIVASRIGINIGAGIGTTSPAGYFGEGHINACYRGMVLNYRGQAFINNVNQYRLDGYVAGVPTAIAYIGIQATNCSDCHFTNLFFGNIASDTTSAVGLYFTGASNRNVASHITSNSWNSAGYIVAMADTANNNIIDANTFNPGTSGTAWTKFIDLSTGVSNRIYNDEASIITLTANDTTPSVDNANGAYFITANTISTAITAFDNGYPGQTITILVNDANTIFQHNGTTITTASNANINAIAGGIYTFRNFGGGPNLWRQIASADDVNVRLRGGTIDGVTIGGTTPAAGTFTTLTSTGNTTLGDASGDSVTVNGATINATTLATRFKVSTNNATRTNRFGFQENSSTDGLNMNMLPGTTGNFAEHTYSNAVDVDNAGVLQVGVDGSGNGFILAKAFGTGTTNDLTFGTNNVTRFSVGKTSGSVIFNYRLQKKQGAAVASANNLTLGSDGNRFQITGTTQINLIDNTDWQGGSIVTLHFQGAVTVTHNTAASGNNKPIMLSGAANFSATANDQLTLQYDSTDSKWYEIARTVI